MKVLCTEAEKCKAKGSTGCGHDKEHEYTQKCDSVCWISMNPHGECREVNENDRTDNGLDSKEVHGEGQGTEQAGNPGVGAEATEETGTQKDNRGVGK